ncbi:hypothetical protein V6N13_000977 [Hibiscus sabdariffa]
MKNDDNEAMGVDGASIDIDLEEKRTNLCSTKVLQPRFTSGLGIWVHRKFSEGRCFIDRMEGDEGFRISTAGIVSKDAGVIFIELTFGVIGLKTCPMRGYKEYSSSMVLHVFTTSGVGSKRRL